MSLYPDMCLKSVLDITIDILEKNNIKGLILDVDNTLINYDRELLNGVDEWCLNLKRKGIQLFIVSNSNKKEKIETVANILKIPYINFAKKPFKKGFLKAAKEMNLKPENIAAVGDQLFTDILGANRCKMTSILVNPVGKKDLPFTAIKRPIEKAILHRYLNKKNKQ